MSRDATPADVIKGEAQWCVMCGHNGLWLSSLRADCVITDPPYDERTHAGALCGPVGSDGHAAAHGVSFAALESAEKLASLLVASANRWAIAFCALEQLGEYRRGAGEAWVRAGVWDKVNPAPQLTGDRPGQAVEGLAIMHRPGRKRWNRGGGAGIWRSQADRGASRPEHPTPKPIALMVSIVQDFTDPGSVVLDPFCGSGTTGVACLRLGRRFIGIELSEEYAEISRQRLEAESRGLSLKDVRDGQRGLFEAAL